VLLGNIQGQGQEMRICRRPGNFDKSWTTKFLLFSWNSSLQDSCDDSTVAKVTLGLWYCWGLVLSNRLVGRSRMAIQLTPTRIKGSKYLLIPKDLAQLLEIDDESILNLTIEDTGKGQRLVYSIREKSSNSTENSSHNAPR